MRNPRSWLITLSICVGLGAGCGSRSRAISPAVGDPGGDVAARARAADWLRTARFAQADTAIDCQPDCLVQEQGFDYARANKIEQPGDCDLARVRAHVSEDFIEGCRAYGQYLEAAARGR